MQNKVFQSAVQVVWLSEAVTARRAVDHTVLHFSFHAVGENEKEQG